VIEAIMMMLMQCVFSTGLVTTGFAEAARQCCPNDEKAQIALTIIFTVVAMIACTTVIMKSAGAIAGRMAASAAKAAEAVAAAEAAATAEEESIDMGDSFEQTYSIQNPAYGTGAFDE